MHTYVLAPAFVLNLHMVVYFIIVVLFVSSTYR